MISFNNLLPFFIRIAWIATLFLARACAIEPIDIPKSCTQIIEYQSSQEIEGIIEAKYSSNDINFECRRALNEPFRFSIIVDMVSFEIDETIYLNGEITNYVTDYFINLKTLTVKKYTTSSAVFPAKIQISFMRIEEEL